MLDPQQGLQRLTSCFDALNIPYFIGGSLASSLHGLWRQTADIDLVADVPMSKVEALAHDLQDDFYADEEMIASAILHGRSFNVIHLQTAFKFDVFPLGRDAFNQSQMRRRILVSAEKLGVPGNVPVATVEDIMLAKLAWYRQSESEQQWKDLLGMVRARREALDREYLKEWARFLHVEDLLDALLA